MLLVLEAELGLRMDPVRLADAVPFEEAEERPPSTESSSSMFLSGETTEPSLQRHASSFTRSTLEEDLQSEVWNQKLSGQIYILRFPSNHCLRKFS